MNHIIPSHTRPIKRTADFERKTAPRVQNISEPFNFTTIFCERASKRAQHCSFASLRAGVGWRGSAVMKPQRNPRYLAWIRTQPCCVCGATRGIEASHTGPHDIGQKSPDSSAIPLCAKHHRTGADSYHRLGPRKFSEKHNLNVPSIVRRL